MKQQMSSAQKIYESKRSWDGYAKPSTRTSIAHMFIWFWKKIKAGITQRLAQPDKTPSEMLTN